MTDTQLEKFEKIIGYEFKNKRLLERALTHSSYCNEIKRLKNQSNERLEFLGDAVLEVTVSDYLFEKYPEKTEGELTKLRASIVCEPTLALCSREIKLGEWILLSKGEEHTGGRNRDSITSDAMEAVIGAIYRDGGFEPAQKYIISYRILRTRRCFMTARRFYRSFFKRIVALSRNMRLQVRADLTMTSTSRLL